LCYRLQREPKRVVEYARKSYRAIENVDQGVIETLARSQLGSRLQTHPESMKSFATWQHLRVQEPSKSSPGYHDHDLALKQARRTFIHIAERQIPECQLSRMRSELASSLHANAIQEGTSTWKMVWGFRWEAMFLDAIGLNEMLHPNERAALHQATSQGHLVRSVRNLSGTEMERR
jgi:hypothetical protein